MEYGAFLLHKLKKKQLQKLEKIQYRVLGGALGYQSSTQTNIMLAEVKSKYFVGTNSWEGTMCPVVIHQTITQWSSCWKNYQF
jgi:hypothetical protein